MFADQFQGCVGTDFGNGIEVVATKKNAEIYKLE